MKQLGKERVDKISVKLYGKDWESLIKPYSKINALASALVEAERELNQLKDK